MLRWLVLAAAVFAAIWLLRRSFGRGAARPPKPPGGAPGSERGALVACAHCGVHLPRGEALERDARLYCCDEHRRLGAR